MSKYNRIHWQTGMEITPQVLLDADNFHIEQQNRIRRLQVMPCYGLLPQSVFNADISIENNTLFIRNLVVQAITPQGELIEINGQDKEYATLDVSQHTQNFYLYISFEETPNCRIVENPLDDSLGMPIAKINNTECDSDYIPPCISINSNKELEAVYNTVCNKIAAIITQVKEQERCKAISLPLSLLELELKNYSTFESPATLFVLVKKISMLFSSDLSGVPGLEDVESFLNESYCHTDIHIMFSRALDCLHLVEEKIKVIEIVEEPVKRIRIAVSK